MKKVASTGQLVNGWSKTLGMGEKAFMKEAPWEKEAMLSPLMWG